MRDLIYLDRPRLQALADALGVEAISKTTRRAAVKLKVVEYERSSERGPSGDHALIEGVVTKLREQGMLRAFRPLSDPALKALANDYALFAENHGQYIYEEMMARQVRIPAAERGSEIPDLTVWISDPDEALVAEDVEAVEHSWDVLRGAYLYLVQRHPRTMEALAEFPFHSGLSALRMVVNYALGEDLFEPGPDSEADWEPYGRGGGAHPTEKLARLNAQVGDSRRIASLYQVRYQSNEQTISVGTQVFRTNDVLGYPVFVETV